jgi:hypothetical protein
MGVVQRFERRLEGLVQGAFAKAFGGWVEPVEVAAALTREAEDKKAIVAAGRVLVPNTYTVELARSDAERLREYDEPLRHELADMVSEAAKERGWSFVGPVEVLFEEVDGLGTGAFRVRSAVVAGVVAVPAPPAASPSAGSAPYLEHGQQRIAVSSSTVIGRGVESDLQLVDTGISRRHAEVRRVGGRVELHDLGSTNGTRVNGQKIPTGTGVTLADGDRITLGASELLFRSGR